MSDSSCDLSDQGRAFSTILTAFVGSILTGISNGYFVAFMTAWICWFAWLRILYISSKALFLSTFASVDTGKPFLGDPDRSEDGTELREIHSQHVIRTGPRRGYTVLEESGEGLMPPPQAAHQPKTPEQSAIERIPTYDSVEDHQEYTSHPALLAQGVNNNDTTGRAWNPNRDSKKPDFLGWVSWTYTHVYSPIINTLWIVSNWEAASNLLHFSRAITIGVSALSFTIDTQARYGLQLGRHFGDEKHIPRLFSIFSAASNTILSIDVVVLLLRAATQESRPDGFPDVPDPLTPKGTSVPIPFLVAYPIFSLIWFLGSYKMLKPEDKGWKQSWGGRIAGAAMGAFGGAFIAAPAFAILTSGFDQTSGATDLSEFLQCEGVSWWRKAVQVLP